MNQNHAWVIVFALTLLATACSTPLAGKKMLQQGFQTQALGKEWIEGDKLVKKGQKKIHKGNAMVKKGETLVKKGRASIKDGEKKIRSGERLVRKSEEEYQHTFPSFALKS